MAPPVLPQANQRLFLWHLGSWQPRSTGLDAIGLVIAPPPLSPRNPRLALRQAVAAKRFLRSEIPDTEVVEDAGQPVEFAESEY